MTIAAVDFSGSAYDAIQRSVLAAERTADALERIATALENAPAGSTPLPPVMPMFSSPQVTS